jgi:iron complex transport system ATP-binding protein
MLMVQDLSFSFPGIPVLNNVSFFVPPRQLVALFGPNGTGKTTLYRCILRLLETEPGGCITIGGHDTSAMSVRDLARRVAYVPQEHEPPFPFLVQEMVLMGRTPHLGGVFGPTRSDRERAMNALEQIGIADLAKRSYTTLSGGQRQLVLLARALAQDAELFLLDEPTASLDFGNQLLLWRTIRHLTRSGRTALICTHDPNHVLWFCDRVLVLGRDGMIVTTGTPQEVITDELVEHLYGPVCAVTVVGDRRVALPYITEQDPDQTRRPIPL